MVIPTVNAAWKGKDNRWIAPKYFKDELDPEHPVKTWNPVSEGDMYFSVLVRVTTKKGGTQVYPYGNNTTMNVVSFVRAKGGYDILQQGKKEELTVADGNEIVDFGWVCVPVSVNWERGKKYVYTLDFTDGVGIQDPEDPQPGNPILGSGIKFTMTLEGWDETPSSTDVTIPDQYPPKTDGTGGSTGSGTGSGDGGTGTGSGEGGTGTGGGSETGGGEGGAA